MKKLFYPLFALAAMAMTSTSCSDELENGVVNSNEAEVSFKLRLENTTGSRAVGDGKTAKELHYAVYKVDTDASDGIGIGTEIKALRGEGTTIVKDDLTAEVKFTLVKGQTYNFLFWAQCQGGSKYYTIDYANGAVEVKYTDADNAATTNVKEVKIAANDENRDAFFKVRKDLKIDGPIEETIILKRPFAQVNVGTQIGSLNDAATAEVWITKSQFVIDNVATKLNTYTGAVSSPTTVAVTYEKAPIIENLTNLKDNVGDLKDVDGKNYEYLAMNYILVNDQNGQTPDGSKQAIINGTFQIYGSQTKGGADELINTFAIPNIPVQRNWRTNIIGDILNETVTFNIVIDPKFDNDHNYYTEKELAYAFANGGEITLDKNVELTKPLILDDKDHFVTINLNGHTITAPMFAESDGTISAGTTDSYPFFVKAGTLNIKGHGWVKSQACKYSMGVFAIGADAKVNIYDGIYENAGEGSDLIYAKNGAKINIYNGTFIACEKKSGVPGTQEKHSALNLYSNGAGDSEIKVYGGRFFEFNPADNLSENPKVSFVAEGYAVTKEEKAGEGTYYKVVPSSEVFANTGDLTLYSNVTADKTVVLAAGQDLDGGNYSLEMKKSNTQYALQPAGGTIKNLSIVGYNTRNSDAKVIRGIYIVKPTSDVVIDNVSVSGVAYPLNTGTKTSTTGLKLTVSNSTFKGWSSWDGGFASASFTKCTFGVGTYFSKAEEIADHWNGMARPYIDTTFEECEFNDGFVIDAKFIVNEGKTNEKTYQPTIILKKCTYKGKAITAADLASLIDAGDPTDKIDIQN